MISGMESWFILFLTSLSAARGALRPDFQCEEDGFFPDPYDCSAYYVCISGAPEWESCPVHLRLRWESPQKVYCDIAQNVECVPLDSDKKPVITEEPRKEDFCLNRADGIYKSPLHCYSFVMCSSGMRIDFNCPNGMSFSKNHGICVTSPYCIRDVEDIKEGVANVTSANEDASDNDVTTTYSRILQMEEDPDVGSGEVDGDPGSGDIKGDKLVFTDKKEPDLNDTYAGKMGKILPEDNGDKQLNRSALRKDLDYFFKQIYDLLSLWNVLSAKEIATAGTDVNQTSTDHIKPKENLHNTKVSP